MGRDTGVGTNPFDRGAGFQVFVQSNNQQGVYADATARDVYFAANPDDLERIAANEFLIIKLLDDGFGFVAYQQRVTPDWLDVTSLVEGSPTFGLNEGEIPKLENGIFVASGATVDPITGKTTFQDSIAVPAASVEIGLNITLSDFGESLAVKNEATLEDRIVAAGIIDEDVGILTPDVVTAPPSELLIELTGNAETSVAYTDIAPLEFVIDPLLFSPAEPSEEFIIFKQEAEFASIPIGGKIRTELWIGTDDTGHKIFDGVFDVNLGVTVLQPPSPQTFRAGNLYFGRTRPADGVGSFTLKGETFPGPLFLFATRIEGFAIQRRNVRLTDSKFIAYNVNDSVLVTALATADEWTDLNTSVVAESSANIGPVELALTDTNMAEVTHVGFIIRRSVVFAKFAGYKDSGGLEVEYKFRMVKTDDGSFTDAGGGLVNVESVEHNMTTGNIIDIRDTIDYDGLDIPITVVDDDNFTIVDTYVSDRVGEWDAAAANNEARLAAAGGLGTTTDNWPAALAPGQRTRPQIMGVGHDDDFILTDLNVIIMEA